MGDSFRETVPLKCEEREDLSIKGTVKLFYVIFYG